MRLRRRYFDGFVVCGWFRLALFRRISSMISTSSCRPAATVTAYAISGVSRIGASCAASTSFRGSHGFPCPACPRCGKKSPQPALFWRNVSRSSFIGARHSQVPCGNRGLGRQTQEPYQFFHAPFFACPPERSPVPIPPAKRARGNVAEVCLIRQCSIIARTRSAAADSTMGSDRRFFYRHVLRRGELFEGCETCNQWLQLGCGNALRATLDNSPSAVM